MPYLQKIGVLHEIKWLLDVNIADNLIDNYLGLPQKITALISFTNKILFLQNTQP